MGAEAYRHLVPYQARVQKALDDLRLEVFKDGAYDGASDDHESVDDALDDAPAETGTRSILDIQFLSSSPELGCASELSAKDLVRYFGTERPTVEQLDACRPFWSDIERGTARYVVIHDGDRPAQLFFAGYSVD